MQKHEHESWLKTFGKNLMHSVRDEAIETSFKLLNQELRDKTSYELGEKLNGLSLDQKEALQDVIIDSIDATLMHFLEMIQQQRDGIDLSFKHKNNRFNLEDTTVDLLEDYWGFIAQYSAYKMVEKEPFLVKTA